MTPRVEAPKMLEHYSLQALDQRKGPSIWGPWETLWGFLGPKHAAITGTGGQGIYGHPQICFENELQAS